MACNNEAKRKSRDYHFRVVSYWPCSNVLMLYHISPLLHTCEISFYSFYSISNKHFLSIDSFSCLKFSHSAFFSYFYCWNFRISAFLEFLPCRWFSSFLSRFLCSSTSINENSHDSDFFELFCCWEWWYANWECGDNFSRFNFVYRSRTFNLQFPFFFLFRLPIKLLTTQFPNSKIQFPWKIFKWSEISDDDLMGHSRKWKQSNKILLCGKTFSKFIFEVIHLTRTWHCAIRINMFITFRIKKNKFKKNGVEWSESMGRHSDLFSFKYWL